MTIEEFRAKWGTTTPQLLILGLIRVLEDLGHKPAISEAAKELAADLTAALKDSALS